MTAISHGLFPPRTLGCLVLTLALFLSWPAAAADAPTTPAPTPQPPTADAKKPFPLVVATPLAPDAWYHTNCSARGLAGVKSPTDKGPVSWESTGEWTAYKQWLDSRWNYLDRARLSAMRTWGNTELASLRNQTRTVYYPFSGPDDLYADTLFPDSKYLLMAGLEPVGTMPDLAKLEDEDKLGPYLQEIKTSLATILAASFFKTKDMKVDFNNQSVDGLMPVIAVFLAHQGYAIDSIQYISLDHEGTLHLRGEKPGAPGVQITYFKGDRSDLRVLLYFQTNLADDGLKENPGYVRLMQRLGPGVTYLKAASYLLYENYFSTIREAILENSVGVVEDDSGVPFRFFKPEIWNVVPYGNYTGPIELFKQHYQQDLADYYGRTAHAPLPFGSGYKYVAAQSSLLVAKKK